ncbi:hypothetical protein [Streptomyces sennicomposti]
MDTDFGMSLTITMGERFGSPTNGWPPSTEYVHPFLVIIVRSIGLERASGFFDAARQAYQREQEVARVGGFQLGFPTYLSNRLGDEEPTLALTAAWEAIKAVHALVGQRDSEADFEQYIDCALAACAREMTALV